MTLGERLAAYGLVLPAGHTLVSLADRPELERRLGAFNAAVWPEFMFHDAVVRAFWDHLFADFPAFQGCLFDADHDLVASLNSAPIAWDGTEEGLPAGWDDQLQRSVEGAAARVPPNTLGALQIVTRPDRRGSGYSGVMLGAMRAIATLHGLRALIACVRPTHKSEHPWVSIGEYARWTREDGLPTDPWIRLHVRLGGRISRPEPASMRMEGTVAEWREWTGLDLPESGEYVPEGAAAPVTIDLVADRGVYLDPNVWVIHEVG